MTPMTTMAIAASTLAALAASAPYQQSSAAGVFPMATADDDKQRVIPGDSKQQEIPGDSRLSEQPQQQQQQTTMTSITSPVQEQTMTAITNNPVQEQTPTATVGGSIVLDITNWLIFCSGRHQ